MTPRVGTACAAGLASLALLQAMAPAIASTQLADTGDFDFVDVSDFPIVRLVISPPVTVDSEEVMALRVLQDDVVLPSQVFALRSEPIEMVLIIDSSGSMSGAPIEAAKAAAIEFVEALPAASDVSVLAFGDEVSVVAGLGATREALVAAITGIEAGRETALYDAVMAAAAAVRQTPRSRQFIVLLSDGGDTVSSATIEDVAAALGTESIGFYAIALAGSEPDPVALGRMAAATGGRVVPASDASALASVYADIAQAVASQYAVVFEAEAGGPTHIDVVIPLSGTEARLSANLELPALATGRDIPTITITPAADRILSSHPTTVVREPGRFAGKWALGAGIVMVGLTLVILFTFALQPVEERGGNRLAPSSGSRLVPSSAGRRTPRTSGLASRVGDSAARIVGGTRRRGIDAALDAAGVAISAGEYLALVAMGTVVSLAIGLIDDSPMLGVLLALGAITGPRMLLARAASKRRAAFADQLEGTLQLIAGSMRAGYGLSQAIATVAEEAPQPTAEEFGRIVVETRVGRDLAASISAAAERMRSDDFAWVGSAISIQQEVGGNLAEVLDAVASTIRDRNQVRRQIQTLSAEGRLSAVILIALPFLAAAGISAVNPGYLDPLFESAGGKAALLMGAVLMGLGIVWIRRIVRNLF